MGCDIHLVVEKRNSNGSWERVLPPPEIYNPWLKEQAEKETGDRRWYRDRVKVEWFDDRNYNLFAILAGVRNSFDFVPIAEPKGLPGDLSPEVYRLAHKYDDPDFDGENDNDVSLGDHSQSWLTLKELHDYDWDQGTKEGGWVNAWNFELWRKEGKPRSWCGGISGGRVEHISYREMGQKIDRGDIQWEGEPNENGSERDYTTTLGRMLAPNVPKGSVGDEIAQTRYYCYVEWPVTGASVSGRFLEILMPALAKLGEPENVRIVFGFDS